MRLWSDISLRPHLCYMNWESNIIETKNKINYQIIFMISIFHFFLYTQKIKSNFGVLKSDQYLQFCWSIFQFFCINLTFFDVWSQFYELHCVSSNTRIRIRFHISQNSEIIIDRDLEIEFWVFWKKNRKKSW